MKVHAYLIGHIKKQMPALWGSKAKKDELIKDMLTVYRCARLPPKLCRVCRVCRASCVEAARPRPLGLTALHVCWAGPGR